MSLTVCTSHRAADALVPMKGRLSTRALPHLLICDESGGVAAAAAAAAASAPILHAIV